jgi:hypothetical protein
MCQGTVVVAECPYACSRPGATVYVLAKAHLAVLARAQLIQEETCADGEAVDESVLQAVKVLLTKV